jgi:cytidine deaminase
MPEVDYSTLIAEARAARGRAYAPYSRYPVGAALLCGSGKVYPGCNVENAAYPMTMCAERTALFSAIAAGEREFVAITVIADAERPVPPCGACRQALLELAPDMPVLLANLHGAERLTTPRELLPEGFSARDLEHDPRMDAHER